MESNRRERELSRVEVVLDEPHFDEATLLSARPVVPLDAVKAESSLDRRWALGLAIVVALLIGAFGATLVYKLRGQKQSTSITEGADSSQAIPPSVEAGVAAVESQESLPAIPKQDDPAVIESTNETAPPAISRESRARASRQPIKSDRQDESREDEIAAQRELRREIRRAEKWEERRLRRIEKAARRENGDHKRSSDDLSRIREIFEGAPRP